MSQNDMASRIRATREARGMSASDLARLTGVTPTAVWNWENNGTRPRHDALSSIAKVLAVTPEFLLSGTAAVGNGASDVDAILRRAQGEVAKAIGMPSDRVKVRFEVSGG